MQRLLLLKFLLLISALSFSNTIVVKNIEELNKANANARPGDLVILQDGEWKNVTIALNCMGTKDQPIVFRAQTAGKVIISGNSMLKLGGSFIVVDGLYFMNGYSGDDAVFEFRIDKNHLANSCRITNCVIDGFNNPKRIDENNWVLFYGKNNKLDHCSFVNKKNMGVLLAVILDDDRSRENFHYINHNYFGLRIPLASNGGEIIRVGVSQHCQFNSNTQIANNYFEGCDGEAEVISIKSGANAVKENIFRECQGSVVLRHGDNNLVVGNLFIGNDKPGTGGVRVINKGQAVVSNIFYKCRGEGFRSPLAIMNGIPNSPAHRYVQVTKAQIISNTFYECAPMSFGEGSDTERTLPPDDVIFSNNTFYNTRDSIIYRAWDDIGGIKFAKNNVSKNVSQVLANGFVKTNVPRQKPVAISNRSGPQYSHIDMIPMMEKKAYASSGASWFSKKNNVGIASPLLVNCATAQEVFKQLERKEPVIIRLTGKEYNLSKPFVITKPVEFTGSRQSTTYFTTGEMQAAIVIAGNGQLSLRNMNISGSGVKATSFISSDSSGPSDHYSLTISDCIISSFDRNNGSQNLFNAYKSMVADSIVVQNCQITQNRVDGFMLKNETDNRGYYNAERVSFTNNEFSELKGVLLSLYRGGPDESTLGPKLTFTKNKLVNCTTTDSTDALIKLTGVQQTNISSNLFTNCNPSHSKNSSMPSAQIVTGRLIHYTDLVRANHIFHNNSIVSSGAVHLNQFVDDRGNTFNTNYKKYY